MAMHSGLRRLGAGLLLGVAWHPASARAENAVLEWAEIARQTVAAENPLVQSRSMAMTQLAVLDAANAPPASADAAVMTAAHDTLLGLYPHQAAKLDSALSAGLAAIAASEGAAQGIVLGRSAAAKILESRKADGWSAKVAYAPSDAPGRWIPTPPAFAPPVGTQWGQVTPFALRTGDQFRPKAPAAPGSARYAKELDEVLRTGSQSSASRSKELTDAARFWVSSAVQTWNPAARQVSIASKRTQIEDARTFAVLNVAIADALIACFDAKYTYNTWRPVTAIRAGVDGVPADPEWLPLIATPPFPAYPSAHACAAGAAVEVLERSFGPDPHAIILTSAAAPGVTFHYSSFKAIADQIDDARVFGGIHTREDQTAGRELGRKVGDIVYTALGKQS